MKTVVRIPGPSCTLKRWMLKIRPVITAVSESSPHSACSVRLMISS